MTTTEPIRMASRAAFLATFVLFGAAGATSAGTPALVIDVASGKVLVSERATDPWFPASITKLMTTYVALDLVRQGRVSMNSLLTVSADAAAEPPSKMGFKPGTQLTLDNALKIIMVKSANDVAMMIGENLGGSTEGFARLMNDASRRLGMRESRWVNANGLPDERQQTSARDMAILARALLTEFPEHDELFRIGALKLGRQVIRNHNGMLGRYPGADGMKTGFICMGGFNIVASATQNGRRLISVVMGYPSARERDLRAADLFDQGFGSLGWGGQRVEDLPPSGAMSPPNVRSFVCGPNKRLPQEDDETAVVALRGGSQNAENPIAALFSPLAFATASAASVPGLGARTSLGPRVAFEPLPIFLGAAPGSPGDTESDGKGVPVRIAAKPVRTKLVGRNPAVPVHEGKLSAPSSRAGGGERIETLQTDPQPTSRAAISNNMSGKPSAEVKPKPGAIGRSGDARRKLGAIPMRPNLPVAALPESGGVPLLKQAEAGKPKPVAAAKGKSPAAARPRAPAGPSPDAAAEE